MWKLPVLVHYWISTSLFDALQFWPPRFWARWLGIRLRTSFRCVNRFTGISRLFIQIEGHACAIFTGINRRNLLNRYGKLTRHTTEPCLELNELITNLQLVGRARPEIEHDLPIPHKLARHASPLVNSDCDMRRKAVVATPFPNCPQQVRLGGRKLLHDYLRIAFSDGVSASIKP